MKITNDLINEYYELDNEIQKNFIHARRKHSF